MKILSVVTMWRKKIDLLRKQRFLGHVAALMTGSVVAQAVPVLLSPVLTRLYSPEDFAAFALFMAVNNVISVVAGGRDDQAILLPSEVAGALNLVILCWLILGSVCLTLAGLVAISYGRLPEDWLQTLHGEWLYLLPLAVFVTASFQILSNWNNRCGRFPQLAMARASQGVSTGAAQCGMGYSNLHAHGLIWGWVGGQCAGLALLVCKNLASLTGGRIHVSRSGMAAVAREYRRFPLLSTWGAVFDSGGLMMVLLIISHSFSSTITGLFSFTQRVLAIPLFLISSAVAQVLHQRIARLNHEDAASILPYILRSAATLAAIALPFIIVLAVFGVELFTIVFGPSWAEAGRYAGLLSLAVGVRFVVSPLTVIMALNHNVKSGVQWQIIYFFSVSTTLWLGRGLPIESFLQLYVLHELLMYSIYFLVIVKCAQRRPEVASSPVPDELLR